MKAYHLPEQIVSNVWLKKGYAWFANGKEVEDRNGKVHIGDDNDFSMMMLTLIQTLTQIFLRVGFEVVRGNKNISIT